MLHCLRAQGQSFFQQWNVPEMKTKREKVIEFDNEEIGHCWPLRDSVTRGLRMKACLKGIEE